jgi:uncharacterized protein
LIDNAKRVALITGASSGIGAAFASAYAKRGCDLVLIARRLERLQALSAQLAAGEGIKCIPIACDLALDAAIDTIREQLKRNAMDPDILVNNAGYSIARTFLDTAWSQQRDFVQVSVLAPLTLTRALLPKMVERRWGRIINVASVAAFSPGARGHTLYPAAKSFLVKMSQSLAAEVHDKGVNVSALCPGQTQSEFADANGTRELIRRAHFLTQSAEAVVSAAIAANESGREIVITGFHNRLAVAAMKLLPDDWTAALIRPRAARFSISG